VSSVVQDQLPRGRWPCSSSWSLPCPSCAVPGRRPNESFCPLGRLRKVHTHLSKLTLDDVERSSLTWDDATPSVTCSALLFLTLSGTARKRRCLRSQGVTEPTQGLGALGSSIQVLFLFRSTLSQHQQTPRPQYTRSPSASALLVLASFLSRVQRWKKKCARIKNTCTDQVKELTNLRMCW
jgi:hypothetical protein